MAAPVEGGEEEEVDEEAVAATNKFRLLVVVMVVVVVRDLRCTSYHHVECVIQPYCTGNGVWGGVLPSFAGRGEA